MGRTLQYPKKTPYEVRQEMDRIEQAGSKPLTPCEINGIDWEKRIDNRQKRRERDMNKVSVMEKKSILSKAASYIMCKRAGDPVLQAMQDQIRESYIKSLKDERDRTLAQDLTRHALKGGLQGSTYGMVSGLLFGSMVAPAKDLVQGSDRTVAQSFTRGAGLGTISGAATGGLLGAGIGALTGYATRDMRKREAIKKLKELGITD